MKSLKTLFLVGAFALLALSSCMFNCVSGSGHIVSEDRKVSDFVKIEVDGAYKVILKQDSTLGINISADDNLMRYIHTDVNNGRLRIHSRKSFCNTGDLVIHIGVHNIEEIRASGAVEVESDGKVTTKDMAFHLTGASKVNMDLNADRVFTKGSGAIEVSLKGQATSHTLELTGSGDLKAFDFVVSDCTIRSTGAGHCQVNVLKELDVNSTGASEVEYKGNPVVNEHKTGAASVTKVN